MAGHDMMIKNVFESDDEHLQVFDENDEHVQNTIDEALPMYNQHDILKENVFNAAKYTAKALPPRRGLELFLNDHSLVPQKHGGNGVGYNYDWAVDNSKTHRVIGIPDNRVPLLHQLMVACSERERFDLSQRIDPDRFVLFFDLDWNIESFSKSATTLASDLATTDEHKPSKSKKKEDIPAFPHRGAQAVDYFEDLRDIFIDGVLKTLEEIGVADGNVMMYNTEHVVLRRTCYKYHIIFPNIRTNASSMKEFVKKLLRHLPPKEESIYFKWCDVVDTQPYTGGLRMIGAPKGKLFEIIGGNENRCHTFLFTDVDHDTDQLADIYRYAYYGPNKSFNVELLQRTSLHCSATADINLLLHSPASTKHNGSELAGDLFSHHTDQLIRDRVSKAIFDMNSTGMIASGTDFSVNGEVVSWKRLSGNKYDEHGVVTEDDCYCAQLPVQSCPFKGGMHKRSSENGVATLYCLLFESRIVLQCYDCTKLDDKARRSVPVDMSPDEVDFLKQADLAAQSVINRSHEAIASVIFNWVKHRVATSSSSPCGKGRSYVWYYFDPKYHIWRQSDKRMVDDMMSINGLVQTNYKDIKKLVLESYKDNDASGAKTKALNECMKKLFQMLQSSSAQNTIMPLIARKLAHYYEDLDPRCRPFSEQLDDKPWLLATKSGVLDFRKSGICRPGRPDDHLSLSTYGTYIAWDKLSAEMRDECVKYFVTLFPIAEERDYALWCFARMLNGERRRHCMYFMLGNGSDGKSVLFSRIFKGMYGRLSGDGQPSLMVGNDEKSSAGPRTDLVHIKGKRVYGLTEPNPKDILNCGRCKQVTGGDLISCAEKNERQQEIKPQCTFFMVLNNKIRIESPPGDDGTWRRIMFIFFRHRFRPTKEKLKGDKYESVGLPDSELTELVERLSISALSLFVHVYQKTEGVAEWPEPESFAIIRESIREENDIWLKYINEVTRGLTFDDEPTSGLTVSQLWTPYPDWLKARGNERRALNIDKFTEFMSTHLGDPVVLNPDEPSLVGWRRLFKVPINSAGKFTSLSKSTKPTEGEPYVFEKLQTEG